MKTLILVALTCFALLVFGGEIADSYSKVVRTNSFDPKALMSGPILLTTNHGIIEIGIERTECFGMCPTYTFILRSDGTCTYKGMKNVDYIGDKVGTTRG